MLEKKNQKKNLYQVSGVGTAKAGEAPCPCPQSDLQPSLPTSPRPPPSQHAPPPALMALSPGLDTHRDTRHSQLHGPFLLTGWTTQKPHEAPWEEGLWTAAPRALTCRAEVNVPGASNAVESRRGSPVETEIKGRGLGSRPARKRGRVGKC